MEIQKQINQVRKTIINSDDFKKIIKNLIEQKISIIDVIRITSEALNVKAEDVKDVVVEPYKSEVSDFLLDSFLGDNDETTNE